MKLEKGVISNTQLMFLTFSFMQAMIMTANFNYALTKQDTWIVVIAASGVTALFVLMYAALARRYAGKDLVQINDTVFGPYFGKAVSALYIWFFFQLIIHYAYFYNSFWITYIMPETPRIAFLIMLMFICAMAVKGGIEVIARCGFLLSLIVAVMTGLIFILLFKDMKFSNLQPMLQTPPKDFIQSLHIMLAIPFLDLVALLVFFPYTAENRKIRKPVLLALCMSTALLLISVAGNVATAGARVVNSTSVSFAITREIDFAGVLTRLDVLIALTLLITIFMKIAVMYYVTAISTARLLNLRSYRPLIIPIGVLVIGFAVKLYPSDMEQVYAGKNVWPFYAIVQEALLPAVTLAVVYIRKLFQKRGTEQ